jgi:hypothetical protein
VIGYQPISAERFVSVSRCRAAHSLPQAGIGQ